MATVQFNINSSQELDAKITFNVINGSLSTQNSYIILTHDIPVTSMTSLKSVKHFLEINTATVLKQICWSYDNIEFNSWQNLDTINFSTAYINKSGSDVWFKIKYTKTDSSASVIYIRSAEINGERDIQGADTSFILNDSNPVILEPADIFKVFNLTGIELSIAGIDNTTTVKTLVRSSTNSGRTWNEWIEVTNDNIASIKFDPLRFTKFQFSFIKTGPNIVKINDLELIGNFQNISNNYKTTSRLGLRSDCSSGNTIVDNTSGTSSSGPSSNSGSKYEVIRWQCDDCTSAPKYNPYNVAEGILPFYEYLSNQINDIYGHEILYFLTDPDSGGSDAFIHEYQLYNVVKQGKLKASVPDNQFPDNQVKFNLFDLDLFDSFEIHIPAEAFRKLFGIEKRPAKEDYLFLCKTNRMYQVEHVQFNKMAFNTTVFYKVILTHYNQGANKQVLDSDVQTSMDILTKNTTLDEILGITNKDETKDVMQPIQRAEITENNIILARNKYTDIINNDLINSTVIISKSMYKLISQKTDIGLNINYGNIDGIWNTATNRTLNMWVSFDSYDPLQEYNLFNNHNDTLGYKVILASNELTLTINDDNYVLPFVPENNKWYALSIIIDQINNFIKINVYSRFSEIDPGRIKNSNLKLISTITFNDVTDHDFNKTEDAGIGTCVYNDKKTNYYMTNIRLFKYAIPENKIDVILNQNIATDGSILIFADNCNSLHLSYYGNI